jgi:hypothetical protein
MPGGRPTRTPPALTPLIRDLTADAARTGARSSRGGLWRDSEPGRGQPSETTVCVVLRHVAPVSRPLEVSQRVRRRQVPKGKSAGQSGLDSHRQCPK